METFVLFGTFVFLLLIGTPVAFCLGVASFATVLYIGLPPVVVFQRLNSGVSVFALMAIPFFILAAELMRIGGLSDRLINLAKALVGWVPGGLAAATVLSCLFFGSISGSSPATVVAIGTIMFPALVAAGYNRLFAIGLIATAGTLGPIVPPSIALIIYGSVTGTSVGQLFAAGLLPAILIASLLIGYCMVYASLKGYARAPIPSLGEILRAFKAAAWRPKVAIP